jgi:aspartyl-tRNA(Asn)/glutamyl-tRNA(Gln) amidotransferase subunit A
MIGTYVLSSGYYDAFYLKAQQLRTKLIEEFNQAFHKIDFLLGPTAPSTAFKIGQHTNHPLHMYLTDILTVAANLTGVPAISIPCGSSQKLPVGLQLMAAQGHDKQLLELAAAAQGVING